VQLTGKSILGMVKATEKSCLGVRRQGKGFTDRGNCNHLSLKLHVHIGHN
jgi:hypothetical protein